MLESREGLGIAVVPGMVQPFRELFEAAPRDVGEQRLAIAVMTIGCRRTDARPARRLGKGKTGRPLFGNQLERGTAQRRAEERRVGKEGVSKVRSRGSPYH